MGAGIVAGRAGLAWGAARLGFDALETYKNSSFQPVETQMGPMIQMLIRTSTEAPVTQKAERVGWKIG
ncbi:hypothetical protein [Flavobacterium aquiphilum]|uniref:hypothetical protein n=1 Tax=Flavobacterium aquiphilum TaxID=3003261 RepID=UPI0024801C98|nr:hypothetical protein [Flavobacterium aquiphilum]